LRARGSSFPNAEALLLILALPLLAVGCGAGAAWGMPVAEIRQRLAVADHGFLTAVDLETRKAEEALAIGPEAPFYLASVFDGIGRPEAAIVMLEIAAERSPEPWRAEAAATLADHATARDRIAA